MMHSEMVYVRRVKGKGRGVFALRPIKKGEMIEKVPVLLVPTENLVGGLRNPALARFVYLWDKKNVAISLGYGSLYNHSYTPNADYDFGPMTIIYTALRDIARDEEITINYNGDPEDTSEVSFKVV